MKETLLVRKVEKGEFAGDLDNNIPFCEPQGELELRRSAYALIKDKVGRRVTDLSDHVFEG